MRLSLVLCFVLTGVSPSIAQDKPKERVSPLAKVTGSISGSNITVNYSQPSVKGRKIWGGLVPYNQVWRTGANEATTFETSKDIKVEGQALPAGKYSLFTIPDENEWTVIFNKKSDQWGAYEYDEKKDQLRVKVKASALKESKEQLTFFIEGNKVLFRWEKTEVAFLVSQ